MAPGRKCNPEKFSDKEAIREKALNVSQENYIVAKRTYESYRDRLKEWREIEQRVRSSILRKMFSRSETYKCLASNCLLTYTTYNGLLYHLNRCSLDEEMVKCSSCGKQINFRLFNDHQCLGDKRRAPDLEKEQCGQKIRKSALRAQRTMSEIFNDETIIDFPLAYDSEDYLYSSSSAEMEEEEEPIEVFDMSEMEEEEEEDDEKEEDVRQEDDLKNAKLEGELKKYYSKLTLQKFYKNRKSYYKYPKDGTWSTFRLKNRSDNVYPPFKCRIQSWTDVSLLRIGKGYISPAKSGLSMPLRVLPSEQFCRLALYETYSKARFSIGFCGTKIVSLSCCPLTLDDQMFILASVQSELTLKKAKYGYLQLWHVRFPTESFGLVKDTKWCPSITLRPDNQKTSLDKTGCVALATRGGVMIYSVPLNVNGLVKFYDAGVTKPNLRLSVRSDLTVLHIDWSPFDGYRKVVGALSSGSVCVWNLDHAKDWLGEVVVPNFVCRIATQPIDYIAWYTELLVVGKTVEGAFFTWNAVSGKLLKSQCFHPSDAMVVSPLLPGHHATDQNVVQAYQPYRLLANRFFASRNPLHKDSVRALDMSADKVKIASVSFDGSVGVFTPSFVKPAKRGRIVQIADRKLIMCTSQEKTTMPALRPGQIGLVFDMRIRQSRLCAEEICTPDITSDLPNNLSALYAVAQNLGSPHWIVVGGDAGFLIVLKA